MAMSATEVERKISQLDNDVSEIYTMIADIQNTQRRHTHRFNEMGVRLDRVIDQLGAAESRLDRLDSKVDTLDTKVDALDVRFDGLTDQVQSLTGTVSAMAGVLDRVAAAVLPSPE